MRMFDDETGWDAARKETRHPASATAAAEPHQKLAVPLRAHLGKWDAIDGERRAADDRVVDANALIRYLDRLLDRLVKKLAARLKFEQETGVNQHLGKFFKEPPNETVRLGLESEIDSLKDFPGIAKEVGATAEVLAILAEIAGVSARGTAAVKAREQAAKEVALVALRMDAWKQASNAARRSVEDILDAYATAHGLPRDYSTDFFPPSDDPPRRKKKDGE